MTDLASGALQVDTKRRTTLPQNILIAAGIPAGSQLVVRVEEPGRIVLESPQLLLAQLQEAIAAGMAAVALEEGRDPEQAAGRSLAQELIAERSAEAAREDGALPPQASSLDRRTDRGADDGPGAA